MFRFIILSAIVCLATCAPAPGFLHGSYVIPAPTSYASRVDVVHSAPIVKTYLAPVVTKTVVATPISYHVPVVSYRIGLGGHGHHEGLGHGHHHDELEHIHHHEGLGHDHHHEGLGHGHHHEGIGHGHGHGHGLGW